MWYIVSQVLVCVFGDYYVLYGGVVQEMWEMGLCELNDLGIGVSEVLFFLKK